MEILHYCYQGFKPEILHDSAQQICKFFFAFSFYPFDECDFIMKAITVFTPSYNRAHLLPRLYASLRAQTSKDFIWMIIDDGSTDGTAMIVEEWKREANFEIQYHYKENGGMHTAHNLAYAIIDTELNVCIDSDDQMPADAVEIIVKIWRETRDKENLAGIIGLDADNQGKVLGTSMPENISTGSYDDLFIKYKAKGDKKFVLVTEKLRKYPMYPEYKNEKLVPLGILYMMMGKDMPFIFSNEILCIVDYQEGGSSNTILKQYKQSPRGFAYARKMHIKYDLLLKHRLFSYVHLISSSIFGKELSLAFKGVNPLPSILLYPFGVLLNLYIRFKIK